MYVLLVLTRTLMRMRVDLDGAWTCGHASESFGTNVNVNVNVNANANAYLYA